MYFYFEGILGGIGFGDVDDVVNVEGDFFGVGILVFVVEVV